MSSKVEIFRKLWRGAFCFISSANAPRLISVGKYSACMEIVKLKRVPHGQNGGSDTAFQFNFSIPGKKVKTLQKLIINFIYKHRKVTKNDKCKN